MPISCELLSDFITPIEVIRILKTVSSHCFLLESAQAHESWCRYSFIGFEPKLEITCKDGLMRIGSQELHTTNPSQQIRDVLKEYKSPRFDYLPTFIGGLVGYFAYDYLSYKEPCVKFTSEDSNDFADVDLMLFDKVIAFDNIEQKIILMVNIALDNLYDNYNKAIEELRSLANLLKNSTNNAKLEGKLLGEAKALFNQDQFSHMVTCPYITYMRAIFFKLCYLIY